MKRVIVSLALIACGYGAVAQAGFIIRNVYVISIHSATDRSIYLGQHLETAGIDSLSDALNVDEWSSLCGVGRVQATSAQQWFDEQPLEAQADLERATVTACSQLDWNEGS